MTCNEHASQNDNRLGVDFGVGILIAGIAGPDKTRYRSLEFSGWSQELPGLEGIVHAIPVLLHYGPEGVNAIGDEVIRGGLFDHPATARWIRNYLLEGSTIQIATGTGHSISYRDAAADFLSAVLSQLVQECTGNHEVIFSLPSGAPDWYAEWLKGITRSSGITVCHTISEHTAAATGYGLSVEEGQIFLVIRFDEICLSVSVVRSGEEIGHSSREMQLVGEACDDTGYRTFSNWVVQDILARSCGKYTGTQAQRMSSALQGLTGTIFARLASAEEAIVEITEPVSCATLPAQVTRADIRRILEEHGFPAALDRIIRRAEAAARSRGCQEDPPVAVLLVGRGFTIPGVQECIRKRFSAIPVLGDHPSDAIARGASLFIPTGKRTDRIISDYALRYWDSDAREHRYRFLVHSGARYPSAGQVARITISAAYDGQTRLGLPLYEMRAGPGKDAPALELVSDPTGGVRLAGLANEAVEENRPVLVNGKSPPLLTANPPALKGEPRFELTFILDRERRLCVTARDIVNGTLVKKNEPVHRLT